MTKTMLFPLVLITTVSLAAIVGGVLAMWTAQVTVIGSVIMTGNIALKLTDTDETLQSLVSESFGGANLAPGATIPGWIKLRNTGVTPGDHVDVTFANQIVEDEDPPGNESTTPMTTVLQVQALRYDGYYLPLPPDANGNGFPDLDDLANWDQEGSEDMVDLPLTDINTDHILDLVIWFHPAFARNEHQGDSVTVTVDFALNQHSSQ